LDLGREQDLLEELARLHGYDRVPETVPYLPLRVGQKAPEESLLTGSG
jgi:phenylalanyl-tRNA synthetase beta chain